MLECLILGDSIAVGVGQARPGCAVAAKVGIGSGAYLQSLFPAAPKAAQAVVISLGVNDSPSPATLLNLRALRAALHARQVTWLLPGLKEEVRAAIRAVAATNGDRLVDTKEEAGPDHLHPTAMGYRLLASWSLGAGEPPATPPATAMATTAMPGTQPLPVVLRPSYEAAPQWLPVMHGPLEHGSFAQGAHFRMWIPPTH